MVHDIVIFGDPVLRQKARPVPEVTDEIRSLADDMIETMYANQGIGLAAEQIGRLESICVIDITAVAEREEQEVDPAMPRMPLVLVNPELIASDGQQVGNEGCLSFPEIYADVKRALNVSVSYRNLDNEVITTEASGFLARVMQHEIDHLNGVLFVDRMSPAQKVSVAGKVKRLKKKKA